MLQIDDTVEFGVEQRLAYNTAKNPTPLIRCIESHGRPEETLEGSKRKRVDMHTSVTYGNRGGTNCQQLNVNGDI
jgi:hypothetical protein